MTVRNLDALFRPSSVAVIGASRRPGTVGAVTVHNLLEGGFEGPVMPVHPRYESVGGILAYPDVESLHVTPELAVVCTPPRTVPDIVARLAARGTRAAVIITAGLAREQQDGRPLDELTLSVAREHGLRLLGPNCVGLLAPAVGLNATFAHTGAVAGDLAFVSQSGAFCTAVLDHARAHRIGFSYFVSLGDTLDVDFGDVIDWLSTDASTRAILLYVESIRDAREFLSASRAASRNKPIVAIKAGRGEVGERAAASHTGALAGSDAVYDYALRRAGILRVEGADELFDAVETLARSRPLSGDRLAIVTNGGGLGVVAADALAAGGGVAATLADATLAHLDEILPAHWSRGNPVDIVGDAPPERFGAAIEAVLADAGVEAVLVLYAPTALADGEAVARVVIERSASTLRPVLASWMGPVAGAGARRLFAEAGIPCYRTPEEAVRSFLHRVRYRRSHELLRQTPPSIPESFEADAATAREVVRSGLASGSHWLTGQDAQQVLAAYGVPVVETRLATDVPSAVAAAEELGFPVALKVRSPDVLHKTDVGGVVLDLRDPDAVREAADGIETRLRRLEPEAELVGYVVQQMARRPGAHELIVGAATDPVFGPFVMFGQGGIAVEIVDDKAVALPPLNLHLAGELMSRTRVWRLLQGYRGRPAADVDAIKLMLVRVSQLLIDVPEIVELDVNPVLADEAGVLELDARLRLEPTGRAGPEHLAIRPYPRELEERCTLPSGRELLLRPIRPEDEPAHRALFDRLDPESIHFRFFHRIKEMPHSELARFTQIDYDREMAFIAVDERADVDGKTLGVVRATRDTDDTRAEFAIVVRPDAQRQGLGRRLLEKMIRYASDRGMDTLFGLVIPENRPMLQLAADLGFRSRYDDQERCMRITRELRGGERPGTTARAPTVGTPE